MNPTEDRSDVESLRTRVETLRREIEGRAAKTESRRRLHLGVGVALCVACCFGMSVLTSQAFQLDAQALTQIGRYQVERNLPAGRQAMGEYLQTVAPDVVRQVVDGIRGAIPQLRPLVVRELETSLRGITGEFERQLLDFGEVSVRKTKADLDARHPGKGDVAKVELLASAVAEQFNQNVEELFLGVYPQYAREFQRVEGYIVDLRERPEEKLTPRERLEKEMFQTLLRLIAREGYSVSSPTR